MNTIKTKLILGGTAAVLAVTVPLAGAASTTALKASLTGKAEAPKAGDRDGKGQATIRVKGSQVCFSLSYSKIGAPSDGHIHKGVAGKAGPVVVGLFTGKAKSSGCVKTTAALAKQVAKSPASFYVNLHNKAYPNGAIRGQLRKG